MSTKQNSYFIQSEIKKAIYLYHQKHKNKLSLRKMAKKFNEEDSQGKDYSLSTLVRYFKEISCGMAKLASETTEESVSTIVVKDLEKRLENARYRALKKKYDHVLEQLYDSENRYDSLLSIKDTTPHLTKYDIPSVTGDNPREAVPVIMLSDWHIEEDVDPLTVNNLNKYNLKIAQERWTTCIQNSLKLVQLFRTGSIIDQVVIWLGGDFITGYIHEELEESNNLSPTEATREAKRLIMKALDFYKTYGNFKKVTVVCSYGNHGRTMKKPRVSTAYKNSYEWMMYKDIQDYYANDPLFNIIVENGFYTYLDIVGTTCRFWHGDDIRYGGGIGGLTVPLRKAIMELNKSIPADYNFMGHYHQCWEATRDCFVNGSGIGYNAYAQRIKASPEEPMQGFKLIDSQHGPTAKLNIRCT